MLSAAVSVPPVCLFFLGSETASLFLWLLGCTEMEAIQEMPQTTLLAGAALVACVFLALISAFRRSPKDAPPSVRMGLPIVGNIRAFLSSPLNMIKDCYDK